MILKDLLEVLNAYDITIEDTTTGEVNNYHFPDDIEPEQLNKTVLMLDTANDRYTGKFYIIEVEDRN